jgi:thimet oligopeptidase
MNRNRFNPVRNREAVVVRFDFSPGELADIASRRVARAKEQVNAILSLPQEQRSFANTFIELDAILSDFNENELAETTDGPALMNYIHPDAQIRDDAEQAGNIVGEYVTSLKMSKELHDVLASVRTQELTDEERSLAKSLLVRFTQKGCMLPAAEYADAKTLWTKLGEMENQFKSNYNNNNDTIIFAEHEMAGVPESLKERTRQADGTYQLNGKKTDYIPFMQNASSSEARKRMMTMVEMREATTNGPVLKQVVEIRAALAQKLGFDTWGDYITSMRMSGSSKRVLDFLNEWKDSLAKKNAEDLEMLVDRKRKDDPSATRLDAWDVAYYIFQAKKERFNINEELQKEYFPADHVVQQTFRIYEQLLGLKFTKVDARLWADGVEMYEIRNAGSDKVIARFYNDPLPREGKYPHAAAAAIMNRRNAGGVDQTPEALIVWNRSPPSGDKPSLLRHAELQTFFHEFGHIMHVVLSEVPYGTVAGALVYRDFVEAPSQMLENWVWDKDILRMLSGHYTDTSKKLPDEMLQSMIDARDFCKGFSYTDGLLFLALYDMELHTKGGDPMQLYRDLHEEVTGIAALPGTNWPAMFGHIVGNYDASYYGYMWAKVIAQDMVTPFKEEGFLNPGVGMRYRNEILAKGALVHPDILLENFLGRPITSETLKRELGI